MLDNLNFQDFEIVHEPLAETPFELLMRVAPNNDWSSIKDISWREAREVPGVMDQIMKVYNRSFQPRIMLRKRS